MIIQTISVFVELYAFFLVVLLIVKTVIEFSAKRIFLLAVFCDILELTSQEGFNIGKTFNL